MPHHRSSSICIVEDVSKYLDHIDLSSNTEPKHRKRHSVDFKGFNEVYEFDRSVNDSREKLWYNGDEYDSIRVRNQVIVKMMKKGRFYESDNNTFRGLEHKLKIVSKERRASKTNAMLAVLEEQNRQAEHGVVDPEGIAEAYRRASLTAQERAVIMALGDAVEVQDDSDEEGKWSGSDTSEETSDEDNARVAHVTMQSGEPRGLQRRSSLRRLFNRVSRRKGL